MTKKEENLEDEEKIKQEKTKDETINTDKKDENVKLDKKTD